MPTTTTWVDQVQHVRGADLPALVRGTAVLFLSTGSRVEGHQIGDTGVISSLASAVYINPTDETIACDRISPTQANWAMHRVALLNPEGLNPGDRIMVLTTWPSESATHRVGIVRGSSWSGVQRRDRMVGVDWEDNPRTSAWAMSWVRARPASTEADEPVEVPAEPRPWQVGDRIKITGHPTVSEAVGRTGRIVELNNGKQSLGVTIKPLGVTIIDDGGEMWAEASALELLEPAPVVEPGATMSAAEVRGIADRAERMFGNGSDIDDVVDALLNGPILTVTERTVAPRFAVTTTDGEDFAAFSTRVEALEYATSKRVARETVPITEVLAALDQGRELYGWCSGALTVRSWIDPAFSRASRCRAETGSPSPTTAWAALRFDESEVLTSVTMNQDGTVDITVHRPDSVTVTVTQEVV